MTTNLKYNQGVYEMLPADYSAPVNNLVIKPMSTIFLALTY